MSQITRVAPGSGTGVAIQTISGNSGGAVPPTIGGNISLLGSGDIVVTGNIGTNTLTISSSGAISDSFPTDNGTAAPVAGVLNLLSAVTTGVAQHNLASRGSGNTVTYELNPSIFLPVTNTGGTQGVYYL